MLEKVKKRLIAFGYKLKDGDEALIQFALQKVEWTIKNDCNVEEVPEGLVCITIDMAVGEFFMSKKVFSPNDIEGLDLDYAVRQIQEGDTSVVFATGEANMTPEQRLNAFIDYLINYGREQFSCYRRLRW